METWDPLTSFVPYDTLSVLEHIDSHVNEGRIHLHYPKEWKYLPLKEYFARTKEPSFTLSFHEIEAIIGVTLPPSAYTRTSFWRTSHGRVRMADAWLSEEYVLDELKLAEQRARFKRKRAGYVKAIIPREITDQKIPDDAAYEINQFMHYIINRYDLRMVQ